MVKVLIDETVGDEYRLVVLLDEGKRDARGVPLPAFVRSWTWHGVSRDEAIAQARGLIQVELAALAAPPEATQGGLAGAPFPEEGPLPWRVADARQ